METDEESGSVDMDYYLKFCKEKIGNHVKMIWIVDSGAGNYETMWLTTSLRGYLSFELEIEVTKNGIHSGEGSGNIPECFRIARIL
jgi:acetylornithine deacetylase/succinyl-diaminopimelate desuccinylase-like protein